MTWHVYASVLQRASCYAVTLPFTSPLQHIRPVAFHSSPPWLAYQSLPRSLGTLSSDVPHFRGHVRRRCAKGRRHFSTYEDLDLHLSRAQISNILRRNEQVASIPDFDSRGRSAVKKFESNQLAANVPNEDRYSSATCLQSDGMLFGVFDGHAGFACAQAVNERLLYYIAVALMPKKSLEELEKCIAQGRPVPSILQWHSQHTDFNHPDTPSFYLEHLREFWRELLVSEEHANGMSPCDALDCAFKRLDADISLEAQDPLADDLMKSTAIQVAFAGCTACVAHVGADAIHVANSGDSRAVLGVQELDGSWSALELSRDHNTNNQTEVEKIKAQHPPSEKDSVIVDDRLLGVLIPLRAFGDMKFKWSCELQQSVLSRLGCGVDSVNIYQYDLPNNTTPPYLDVTPEIMSHKLRPQDRFLILGTDGLWDELCSQEAVQLVGEHLSRNPPQAPVSPSKRQMKLGIMRRLLTKWRGRASPAVDINAATHLIRHALGTGDYGNLCKKRLAWMLALPKDIARMYRDDITVTVVHLNPGVVGPQQS